MDVFWGMSPIVSVKQRMRGMSGVGKQGVEEKYVICLTFRELSLKRVIKTNLRQKVTQKQMHPCEV